MRPIHFVYFVCVRSCVCVCVCVKEALTGDFQELILKYDWTRRHIIEADF